MALAVEYELPACLGIYTKHEYNMTIVHCAAAKWLSDRCQIYVLLQ